MSDYFDTNGSQSRCDDRIEQLSNEYYPKIIELMQEYKGCLELELSKVSRDFHSCDEWDKLSESMEFLG